jgi:hypothetical protein
MSDANNAAPAATPATSDIDAKLSAITQAIQETNARNAALEASLQQIAAMNAKPVPKEELNPYDADFVEKVVSKAVSDSTKETQRQLSLQQAKQAAINAIALDYPELANASSDLTKDMVKIHSSLPASLKDTPEGYRLAAREAAAQQGIQVKSKRAPSEDFSMSSQGSSSTTPRKKNNEVSEAVEIFKEIFKDHLPKDKDLDARLIKRSQRNFGKYE